MTNTRVIPTTEGRLIEVEEGALRKPPPKTKPKVIRAARKGHLKRNPEHLKGKTGHRRQSQTIPGYREWWGRQLSTLWSVLPRENRPGRQFGCADGESKTQAIERWNKAKEKAKIHMANIKKVAPDLLGERAEKAMLITLEVMEAGTTQDIKLKAARQVLEWTAAKPVNKSEVTVNAAEAWLATIAEQAKDGED